jgi:hypothetical protein
VVLQLAVDAHDPERAEWIPAPAVLDDPVVVAVREVELVDGRAGVGQERPGRERREEVERQLAVPLDRRLRPGLHGGHVAAGDEDARHHEARLVVPLHDLEAPDVPLRALLVAQVAQPHADHRVHVPEAAREAAVSDR